MRALAAEFVSLMALAGRDRRGLAEIVAIATVVVVIGSTVCLQLVYSHEAARELIVVLAATCGVLPIRGVQSAMERSASTEKRNIEASELKAEASEFKQATAELRREVEDMRRANQMLLMLQAAQSAALTAAQPKKE